MKLKVKVGEIRVNDKVVGRARAFELEGDLDDPRTAARFEDLLLGRNCCRVCGCTDNSACEQGLTPAELELQSLRRQLAKAQRQVECYRATRSFWCLIMREAIAKGDVEAVKTETARAEGQRKKWHEELYALRADNAKLR